MADPRPTPPERLPGASLSDRPLSRRQFLGAGAGATASLVLAGCGGLGGPRTITQTSTTIAPSTFRSEPALHPPAIIVDRRPADPSGERFVLTDAHGVGQQGPMILDRAGRLRWFLPVSDHGSLRRRAMNLRVQHYRGEPVLSFWLGALDYAHGVGHYEILDQRYQRVATVHAAGGLRGDLHEFLITPQDTALLTAYGTARGRIPGVRGRTRLGDYFYCCCQEIDIATGELLLEWRSDEQVAFSGSHLGPPNSPRTPWDYFHMNSINIDPSDGSLIISSRNFWQVYKVDRRTGETLWRLGGDDSDFEIEPRARFAFQHHVTPHADGVYTVFDNEGGPPDEARQSRGLVLKVDEERGTVRALREYHHLPPVLSQALGSVELLDHGDVFIGWGQSSYFTEWNARGEIVLDARLAGDVVSYRAFQQRWRGMPTQPPKFVVQRTGRRATMYVSWNGATVHRRWRILGGPSAQSLAELRICDAEDFETVVELDPAPGWLRVEALDARGDVVARSDALQVSD
jgi:hypothetical protein